MALQSKLFRGDAALEACLIKDSAHVVGGARGAHVPKLQRALATLDGALIATSEVAGATYGPTTAAAVLAYKRERRIINKSYQTQADDIVGKMTIASLDKEMSAIEHSPIARGCQNEQRTGPTRSFADGVGGGDIASRTLRIGDAPQAEARFPLRVVFQTCTTPTLPSPNLSFQQSLIRRGNELLAQQGLKLAPQPALESFPYTHSVDTKNAGDVSGIRKAAEKASPGSRNVLRFIFCEFEPQLRNETATAQGAATTSEVAIFRNFVLMNPQTLHPDRGTFVHEAIHASDDRFMGDIHDQDLTSIFSHGPARTVLKPVHAISLRNSFFGAGT